jgi:hypothetical protein
MKKHNFLFHSRYLSDDAGSKSRVIYVLAVSPLFTCAASRRLDVAWLPIDDDTATIRFNFRHRQQQPPPRLKYDR